MRSQKLKMLTQTAKFIVILFFMSANFQALAKDEDTIAKDGAHPPARSQTDTGQKEQNESAISPNKPRSQLPPPEAVKLFQLSYRDLLRLQKENSIDYIVDLINQDKMKFYYDRGHVKVTLVDNSLVYLVHLPAVNQERKENGLKDMLYIIVDADQISSKSEHFRKLEGRQHNNRSRDLDIYRVPGLNSQDQDYEFEELRGNSNVPVEHRHNPVAHPLSIKAQADFIHAIKSAPDLGSFVLGNICAAFQVASVMACTTTAKIITNHQPGESIAETFAKLTPAETGLFNAEITAIWTFGMAFVNNMYILWRNSRETRGSRFVKESANSLTFVLERFETLLGALKY